MMLEDNESLGSASGSPVYQEIRARGVAAAQDHLWEEALSLFGKAWDWAIAHGDEIVRDRAFCNLSLARIHLRQADGCISQLGEILMRTRDPETRWLASYNLARACLVEKKFDRGLFYARLARDQATAMSREDLLGVSLNELGNLLLGLSRAEQATAEYEEALKLIGGATSKVALGTILDNLGYCRVLAGRLDEGFGLLFRSWRLLIRLESKQPLVFLHLDLSFAYLEIGRPRPATRHAAKALELARDLGDRDSVKNALFLLGESANEEGDLNEAKSYYDELQAYFPELPVVTDLLLAVDTRQLINLKA